MGFHYELGYVGTIGMEKYEIGMRLVETQLYVVFAPTLEAFLWRFSTKNGRLGVLFGSRNRGFTAQEAHQFSISPSQLYQRILIHSGNPLIYVGTVGLEKY